MKALRPVDKELCKRKNEEKLWNYKWFIVSEQNTILEDAHKWLYMQLVQLHFSGKKWSYDSGFIDTDMLNLISFLFFQWQNAMAPPFASNVKHIKHLKW